MATFSVMQDVPNPIIVDAAGTAGSGYVLKAFLPGTTTNTSIAIDSAGASPQATITANAEGKWEVTGNEILPYIDRKHKWGIFKNATDAAANTPFYMGPFDNVDINISIPRTELIIRFDTVAAMVASTGLLVGDIVETAGYFSKGDDGDNRYEIVAAATGTDDGGEFIDLATHQAKALFPKGLRSVKQWGAVGDGVVADESAELQAALDYIAAFFAAGNKPPALYFPAGIYKITSELNLDNATVAMGQSLNGIVLYGDSKYSVFIQQENAAGNVRALRIEAATIDNVNIFFKMTIRGLSFAMINSAGVNDSCVKLKGIDQLTINDCVFRSNNTDNDLLETQDISNSWIYDNEFNKGRHQFKDNATTDARGSFLVQLHDNEFLDNIGTCIFTNDFFNCKVYGNILAPTSNTLFDTYKMDADHFRTVVSDNLLRFNKFGMQLTASSQGVTVKDNEFHKSGSFVSGGYGIHMNTLRGIPDVQGDLRTVIDGNSIQGQHSDSMLITNSDYYDVTNNILADIAVGITSCIRVSQTDSSDVDDVTMTGNVCHEAGIRIQTPTGSGVYKLAFGHPQDNTMLGGNIRSRMSAAPTGGGWFAFVGFEVEKLGSSPGQPTSWINTAEGDSSAPWKWGIDSVLSPEVDTNALVDIGNPINTDASKVEGFTVFNKTTGLMVVASGNADGSVWVFLGTGNTAHTPA